MKTGLRMALVGGAGCGAALMVSLWAIHRTEVAPPRIGQGLPVVQGKGSVHFRGRSGEASSGWNLAEDEESSVRGAIDEALPAGSPPPDFVLLVYGGKADGKRVLAEARRILGPTPKLFGLDSHHAEILDSGSLAKGTATEYGVSLLNVRSPKIRFGVGAVEFRASGSPREAGSEAVRRAMRDAGKAATERPQMILVAPTKGSEEQVLDGIEDVVGRAVPVLGGTAGPLPSVIGGDIASRAGVSVAVMYTALTVGWTFEAGYDVSLPQSGVVTKTEGHAIVEIDRRPAWEVYDQWLDGRLMEAMRRNFREAGRLLALNPCYREFKAPSGQVFAVFSHAWPEQRNGTWYLAVSTSIQPGDRIHLSHGTWEILMNRVATLPRAAKARGGLGADDKPLFGIGFLCAGVAGVFPPAEMAKLPLLLNYSMNEAPYLAAVTSGEQGFLPGIGNKHANLSTGFLVVRDGN